MEKVNVYIKSINKIGYVLHTSTIDPTRDYHVRYQATSTDGTLSEYRRAHVGKSFPGKDLQVLDTKAQAVRVKQSNAGLSLSNLINAK